MTDKELKTLKENLWHAADVLRAGAHLAANKYGQPILGLIFLRYADILFKQHKAEIDAEFARLSGTRMVSRAKILGVVSTFSSPNRKKSSSSDRESARAVMET